MLNALLAVPVKILLSIAGALLTLNFATFITKHLDHHESPMIAARIECEHNHANEFLVQLGQAQEERARILVLEGLLHDENSQAEMERMIIKIERDAERGLKEYEEALSIYR